MKNIYAIVLVAAAVAFTVFAFWGNSRKGRENRAAQAEAVSDWMTFQGMAASYDLSGLPVTDDNGETMSFADIGTGGTAEIKVTYVSTGWGDFMRDIEVKTNLRSQPYVLEFDGTIK